MFVGFAIFAITAAIVVGGIGRLALFVANESPLGALTDFTVSQPFVVDVELFGAVGLRTALVLATALARSLHRLLAQHQLHLIIFAVGYLAGAAFALFV